MSKETGFIKLFRQFQSWQHYQDEKVKSVFLDLLLNANFEDKKWNEILIPRGSIFTSVQSLVESVGLSTKSVRNALEKLVKTDEIIIKSSNKGMLISIKNYEKFQNKNTLIFDKNTSKIGANKRANKILSKNNDKIGTYNDFKKDYGQTKGQQLKNNNNIVSIYNKESTNNIESNNKYSLNNNSQFLLEKQCEQIIDRINKLANRRFTKTVKSYNSKIKNAIKQYGFENIIKILDLKYKQWSNSKNQIMLQHFNPETLFKPEKIDKYFNELSFQTNEDYSTSNPFLELLQEIKS